MRIDDTHHSRIQPAQHHLPLVHLAQPLNHHYQRMHTVMHQSVDELHDKRANLNHETEVAV